MLKRITSAATIHDFLGQEGLQGFLGEYNFFKPETTEELEAAFLKFLPQLLNVALREITPEQAESEPHLATTYPKNATACLIFFCRSLNGIVETVPIVFATLSRKGVLHPVIATNINDIITSARLCKETAVCDRVRIALNAEVMHGAIRQLSHSTTLADMILNLFDPIENNFIDEISGGATEATKIASRQMFTDHWISQDFPLSLIRYVTIAMSTEECLPYFHFVGELITKAEKSVLGALTDVLMAEEAVETLFDSVLAAAQTPNALKEFPLVAEGVRLIHTFVSMALAICEDPTEDVSIEKAVAAGNNTLRKFRKTAPLLLQVVRGDLDSPSSPGKKKRLGELKYRIIRLLNTCIDTRCLRDAVFLPSLISTVVTLAEDYPNSDLVMSVLDSALGSISQMTEEEVSALLSALDSAVDDDAADATTKEEGESSLVDKFVQWRLDEKYVGTSLAAHSLYYLHQLNVNNKKKEVAVAITKFNKSSELEEISEEVKNYQESWNGDHFHGRSIKGAADNWDVRLQVVVHKEMLNPKNVDLTDLAERVQSVSDTDDKAASLMNSSTTSSKKSGDGSSSSERSSRYSAIDLDGDDEDNKEGGGGMDDHGGLLGDGDMGGLLVDGKNFSDSAWGEEGDGGLVDGEAVKSAAEEQEDEWASANDAFQRNLGGSVEGIDLRPSSAGSVEGIDLRYQNLVGASPSPGAVGANLEPPRPTSSGSMGSEGEGPAVCDSPARDGDIPFGGGSGSRPTSSGSQQQQEGGGENMVRMSTDSNGSEGGGGFPAPTDGFGASGNSAAGGEADDEDVMMMTPPATPPTSGGSDGGAGSAIKWRPGSSGMDGLLPPNSAGSLGSGLGAGGEEDVIPPPPAGVVGEDDDDDDEAGAIA